MYLTREEFGLDLFEAIKCIGGLLAIQDQHNAAVHHNDKRRQGDLLTRKEALKKRLELTLHKLTPQEMTDLLQRYPFVASL